MSPSDLLSEIDHILEESKTALLATVGPDERARVRWMTPRRLKLRPPYLYSVSEADASKVREIRHNPKVTWLIQRASLKEVITLRGSAVVVDDAGLLQEFLEAVGKDLFMVWHLLPALVRPHLVVLETVIGEAEHLDTLAGKTTRFTFGA